MLTHLCFSHKLHVFHGDAVFKGHKLEMDHIIFATNEIPLAVPQTTKP